MNKNQKVILGTVMQLTGFGLIIYYLGWIPFVAVYLLEWAKNIMPK